MPDGNNNNGNGEKDVLTPKVQPAQPPPPAAAPPVSQIHAEVRPPPPPPGEGREGEPFKFGKAFVELEEQRKDVNVRIAELQTEMVSLAGRSRWSWKWPWDAMPWKTPYDEAIVPILPFAWLVQMPQEELTRQRAEIGARISILAEEKASVDWKQLIVAGLGDVMMNTEQPVSSVEDVLNIFGRQDISEEDIAWLQERISDVTGGYKLPLTDNPEAYMKSYTASREQLYEDLSKDPTKQALVLHEVTVDEITRAMFSAEFTLPEGLDWPDVRDILKNDPDYLAEIEDVNVRVRELQQVWAEEQMALDLIREGAMNAEIPPLSFWQTMGMLLQQPALLALEAYDNYAHAVIRPVASWAIRSFPNLGGEGTAAMRVRAEYDKLRETGLGAWNASATAFEQWDVNTGIQLLGEMFFDPMLYLDFGIATKILAVPSKALGTTGKLAGLQRFVAGTGSPISKVITSSGSLTKVAKWSGAIEYAWMKTWDIPVQIFGKGFRTFWSKIPKLPGQRALAVSRSGIKELRSYLLRHTGKDWIGLTADRINESFAFARKSFMDNPQGLDKQHQAGRLLTPYEYIDADLAGTWLGRTVDPEDMLALTNVNDMFDNVYNGAMPSKEAAASMLAADGIHANTVRIGKLSKELEKHRVGIFEAAGKTIEATKPKTLLDQTMRMIEKTELARIDNPLWRFNHKSGKITGWMTRGIDRFTRNSVMVTLDRKLSSPIARQYLLFTNYGPFNFLENAMRSWLGAGEIFYPRNSSPRAEAARLFREITETPWEFTDLAVRDFGLEMRITVPTSGKTALFKEGRIPLVTKSIKGKGFTIRVGDQDFKIRNMLDWNNMWGEIGEDQKAWYMISMWKQKMAEETPDSLQMIADVFAKYEPELANMTFLAKGERESFWRTLTQDGMAGPGTVRAHDVPITELEARQGLRQLNRVLDRTTDIDSMVKAGLRQETLDGTIFRDIDGRITAYREMARETDIAGLAMEVEALDNLADMFRRELPETTEDAIRDMGFLSDLSDAVSDRISDARKTIQNRASELQFGERAKFYEATHTSLGKFMDSAQNTFDNMIDDFQRQIDLKKLIDDATLDPFTKQLDVIKMRHANALDARRGEAKLIQEMVRKTPPRQRDDAFWEMFQGRRSKEVWEPYWKEERRLYKALMQSRRKLAKLTGNTVSEPSITKHVGKLAPIHVAHLFQTNGDSLAKALTKVGGITKFRGRDDFVNWVREAAEEMAERSKMTADAIGFTEDAIGEVYDQMFRTAGIDPSMAADSPLGKTILDLEEVRKQLHSIETGRVMRGDDYDAYSRVINGVADDLEELPMFRAADAFIAQRPSRRVVADIGKSHRANGGSTFNISEGMGDMAGKKLYAVSVPGHEVRIKGKNVTATQIKQYIDDKWQVLRRKGTNFGSWYNEADGYTYLDVTRTFSDREHAIQAGIKAKQIAIMDLHTLEEIPLAGMERVHLMHFGAADLDVIDPAFKGTGKTGAEGRFATEYKRWFDDGTFTKRSYYFTDPAQPEIAKFQRLPGYEFDEYLRVFHPEKAGAEELALFRAKREDILVKMRKQFGAQFGTQGQASVEVNYATARALGYEAYNVEGRGAVIFKALRPDKTGDNMAKEMGVRFEGMQEAGDNLPAYYTFTDPETSSTFLATDLQMAKERLVGMRESFGARAPEFARPTAITLTPEQEAWHASKENAMKEARVQFELDFTDYNNDNMVDAAMKMLFPFWTYERDRWVYLPRLLFKKPSVGTSVGRYMTYTDTGYLPIPGTDLQFNLLRGTVLAGGMRRLAMRDYPEYHDLFPGMEAIDYMNRIGFYFNPLINTAIVAIGAAADKPEWGEVVPGWAKSAIDIARAVSPETAGRWIDHIFPDRMRSFYTMKTLGSWGYDADEIWRKIQTGKALTEEEQSLWLRAEASATGLKGVLMEQTGIFRIQPREYSEIRADMMATIEAMTGIPVRVQEVINQRYPVTGMRLSDYYQLDISQQKVLQTLEGYDRFRGIMTPLIPSGWQITDVRRAEYYDLIDKLFEQSRTSGLYDDQGRKTDKGVYELNTALVNGEISPSQWRSRVGDLKSKVSTVATQIGATEYSDVPKTFEELEELYRSRGEVVPPRSASQELLYEYYQMKPELRWDWESDTEEFDFDGYYARVDTLLDSLDEPFRSKFITRLQAEWSPAEILYWNASRDYLRAYRQVRNLVLQQYTPDQREAIRNYEVERSPAERERLRAVPDGKGGTIIATFRSDVKKIRENLRMAAPMLDAWLYFWDYVDSFKTSEAEMHWNTLLKNHMNQALIK